MSAFQVTHKSKPYTVAERSFSVTLNDDNSLRSIVAVGALDAPGGEMQRTANVSVSRAVEILTAAGVTPSQFLTGLRALMREGILDHYDDSRQPPAGGTP